MTEPVVVGHNIAAAAVDKVAESYTVVAFGSMAAAADTAVAQTAADCNNSVASGLNPYFAASALDTDYLWKYLPAYFVEDEKPVEVIILQL